MYAMVWWMTGRLAIAILLAGAVFPLVEQAAFLRGGGFEEWSYLDILVPLISLVGAVEIANVASQGQGEGLNGSSNGSSVGPLGQQLWTVGSSLGLSTIASQIVTILRAWESLEIGSGRSAMLVVAVMLLQKLWDHLLVPTLPWN